MTGSPALTALLALSPELFDAIPAATRARTLVVELLAHQFAMPVLWITTQDVMFHAHTQRLIEMGPAATLATMARRSLEQGIYGDEDEYAPAVLWWKQDSDAVL